MYVLLAAAEENVDHSLNFTSMSDGLPGFHLRTLERIIPTLPSMRYVVTRACIFIYKSSFCETKFSDCCITR